MSRPVGGRIRIRYVASTKSGRAQVGTRTFTLVELATWVENRCRAGWRQLEVWPADQDHQAEPEQLAGIVRDEDTGRRIWWA